MTYAEWYVASMYDLLDRGGRQEDIDTLVTEINSPTQAGLVAFVARRDVAYMGALPCGDCGEMIIARDADPQLDKDMRCPSCSNAPTTNPP